MTALSKLPTLELRTDFREIKLPKGPVLEQLNKFNDLTVGALKNPHGRVLIERLENGQLQLEVNNSDSKRGPVTIKRESLSEDFPKYLAGLTRTTAQIANSSKYEAAFMTNNPVLERLIDLRDKIPDEDLVAEIIGNAIPTEQGLQNLLKREVGRIQGGDKEKKFLIKLLGVTNSNIKDADLVSAIKDELWQKVLRLDVFIERFNECFTGEHLKKIQPVLDKLTKWLEKMKALQTRHRSSTSLVDLCPSIVSGGPKLNSKTGTQKRRVGSTYEILDALAFESVMVRKMMGLEEYFLAKKVPA